MELCFIWVSAFRNIRQQGFNLSSKYRFSYDPDKNFLDINDNPRYIPRFFQENITNVTGIVGENAAGKTNLLELINYLMDGGNTRIAGPFLMVFSTKDGFIAQAHEIAQPKCSRPVRQEKYTGVEKRVDVVYFSNTFDGRRHEFGKTIHDLSSNGLLYGNNFRENIQTSLKREVLQQIQFLQSNVYNNIQRNELDIKPTLVQFISPTWENIYARAKNFDRVVGAALKEDFTDLYETCRHFRTEMTRRRLERPFIIYTAFLVMLDFLCNEMIPEANGKPRPPEAAELRRELKSLRLGALKIMPVEAMFDAITGEIAVFIDKKYPYTFEKFKFLRELDGFSFQMLQYMTAGTYSNRKYEFRANLNTETERFIRAYIDASTQLSLSYTMEWPGLSAGQKAFLTMYSRFYAISGLLKTDHVIVTIDEGDLYFHPRWQVEFLSRLVADLPQVFSNKKIQLILSTHSPFLVSDLTKDHLIFLRKNGTLCEAIPPEKIKWETFGGNIGELYLNAFFLDGNLISNFAAQKIRELLERVKSSRQSISRDDQLLIDQIGDKLIQYQLKKIRDDKN